MKIARLLTSMEQCFVASFALLRKNVIKLYPISIPSGISLCHPQNIAYCTDGSKKFLLASFKIVSMPSRRTSALSNCKIIMHAVKFYVCYPVRRRLISVNVTCFSRHFLIFSTSTGSSLRANSAIVLRSADCG